MQKGCLLEEEDVGVRFAKFSTMWSSDDGVFESLEYTLALGFFLLRAKFGICYNVETMDQFSGECKA